MATPECVGGCNTRSTPACVRHRCLSGRARSAARRCGRRDRRGRRGRRDRCGRRGRHELRSRGLKRLGGRAASRRSCATVRSLSLIHISEPTRRS
eukprot:4432746-Prymnesium_polylepis.1